MPTAAKLKKLKKKDLIALAEQRSLPVIDPVTGKKFTVAQLKESLSKYIEGQTEPAAEEDLTLTDIEDIPSDSEDDSTKSVNSVIDGTQGTSIKSPEHTSNEKPAEKMTTKEEFSKDPNLYGIVKNWDVSFDTTNDPVEFLERLDELVTTCGVENEKLIPLLPRFFRGRANLWYRNNKDNWVKWKCFVDDFKLYFYPRDYEGRLQEQIVARKQTFRESFIEYLTDIQTLMRRYGMLSDNEQLRRVYENMNANYKLYIKRQDFANLPELIRLCADYEGVTRERDKSLTVRPQPETRAFDNKSLDYREETKGREKYIYNYDRQSCCWSCGRPGHASVECRGVRKLFCSGCGRLGVLSRNCCRPGSPQGNRRGQGNTCTSTANEDVDERPFVEIELYGRRFRALLDTGSTSSYIDKEVVRWCQHNAVHGREINRKISLADGTVVRLTRTVPLSIVIAGVRLEHEMYVLPKSHGIIVGMDLIKRIGMNKLFTAAQEEQQEPHQKPPTPGEILPVKKEKSEEECTQSQVKESPETAVEYRAETQNEIADELVRNPIRSTRIQDREWYERKLQDVQSNPGTNTGFCVRDGKLYKQISSAPYGTKLQPGPEWKLCIPSCSKTRKRKRNHGSDPRGDVLQINIDPKPDADPPHTEVEDRHVTHRPTKYQDATPERQSRTWEV
ncbi:retrotransposon gag protein domain-containing protein [Phthorimaea operculella]|nr:retrotransposon gag protein domain-containing protein [Phthorimaea operculella]